jgi:O-acetylhomoserine/O-acetylserine sulfhydrylase-like pyridoxal-dependent enzyme
VEAISNPAGRVPDFDALRQAATEQRVMLIIDTTLAACMPRFNALDYADVITASLSKAAGGGGNKNMGGAIITRGDFAWDNPEEQLSELKSYFKDANGQVIVPQNPLPALIAKIGAHEGGAAIAPEIALSIAENLQYVPGNVQKMCANARMLAELLKDHPKVKSVQLPGFNTDPANDARFRKYFADNHFVMMIDLHGDFEAAGNFIDSEELSHAVLLGQKITGVSNPGTSTHRSYPEQKLNSLGIYRGTIRMSVGTEDEDVLRAQVLRALAYNG